MNVLEEQINKKYSEKDFFEAIANSHLVIAETIFLALQKDASINWNCVDQKGRTFLTAALAVSNYVLAEKILKLNENNHTMIFSVDKMGRNSIWYAANYGSLAVLKKLITIAKDIPNGQPGYKSWLIKDKKNKTPLFAAVTKMNHFRILVLLSVLDKSNADDINYINQITSDVRTALQIATTRGCIETVAYLLNYGADPLLCDRWIDGIAKKSGNAIKLIYENMDENKKLAFIVMLQEYLKSHSNDIKIADFLKGVMPVDIETGRRAVFNENELSPFRLQHQSTAVLANIIEQNRLYIEAKRGQPLVSTSAQFKAKIFMALAWVIYIGLDIALYVEASSHKGNDGKDYFIAGIMVNVMGLFLIAALSAIVMLWARSEITTIPQQDWAHLLQQMQDEVISKLQSMERNAILDLPTSISTIRELEYNSALLSNDMHIDLVIQTFMDINNLLSRLKVEINRTSRPLMLMYSHYASQMNQTEENHQQTQGFQLLTQEADDYLPSP